MGILDKKNGFAFVNNASVAASSNVEEFINSGAADSNEKKKAMLDVPKKRVKNRSQLQYILWQARKKD